VEQHREDGGPGADFMNQFRTKRFQ
jgi:hypothetical protein